MLNVKVGTFADKSSLSLSSFNLVAERPAIPRENRFRSGWCVRYLTMRPPVTRDILSTYAVRRIINSLPLYPVAPKTRISTLLLDIVNAVSKLM